MNSMGLNEIREAYLRFFESQGHLRLKSFSLVPKNDKSLLLINAGMAPLKPYFTGLKMPPKKRVTTCQKCIRTGDIENVGITSRHATFFEMLGNFSFGDYFKEEVIPWAWKFVTEILKISKDRLYVTIYLDDDEAFDIWTKKTDIDPKRIFRLGKGDNFWEHGEGPCGPCSEIHYDRGEGKIETVEQFVKAGECDRVVEFWNLVFTQFNKEKDENYSKLSHPNIDTGMGLERIATIMQGVDTIFEADTIKDILDTVCKTANIRYGIEEKKDISVRIITDHIRSIVFMISDGILPSNEGRGYVLRRLLRRAERHGKLLGIDKLFLYNLCDVVIKNSCEAYPELKEKENYIKKVIKIEEKRFLETIDSGMNILKDYMENMKENNEKILSGEKTFKLYDTYGFPCELTSEILADESMKIDMDGFNKEMEKQRVRARSSRQKSNYMGQEDSILNKIPLNINIQFVGYNNTEYSSEVVLLIENGEFVNNLKGEGIVITKETPFYAEMGGQIGDTGIIANENFEAKVIDCKKNISSKIFHMVKVTSGELNIGDTINMKVDVNRRKSICKNHTATHMLQAALIEVLGEHVQQSGSYVDDKKLRFDFTHFSPMTEQEIKKVEDIMNGKIMDVYPVKTVIMSLEEAKESGAKALFDEKYKDDVRVVSVGNFSKELCGGTHIKNSGELGLFKILSETGVAAGIRRIEAVTGLGALQYVKSQDEIIKGMSSTLRCTPCDMLNRINDELNNLKEQQKQIDELKAKIAFSAKDEIIKNAKDINGVKVVTGKLNNIDSNALRELAEKIRNEIKDGIVVLGSDNNNKVNFIAMATKDVVKKGVHCGNVIREIAKIAGGGGGGRPDMAQAGGKFPQKLSEALNKVYDIIQQNVK